MGDEMGLKHVILLVIAAAVLVAGVLYAVNWYYTVFNIHGEVSTGEGGYRVINMALNITVPEGSKAFPSIAWLDAGNNTGVWFRVIGSDIRGDMKIAVNGKAILRSAGRSYTINMPCLLVKNMPCYRIQMLIPGYDAPLRIMPGNYSVTLILTWRAEGRGEFNIELAMIKTALKSKAQIIPIGSKPGNTDGWVTAEESTRTYALLVEKTDVKAGEDGYGYVKAWAWLFSPSGEGAKVFKFRLVDQGSNNVVAELKIPVEKHGFYYQILLLIKAKPGEYMFHATYPIGAELKIPIRIQG